MKLIVRLKGGVGNQLYSYAAAQRLAIVNAAELIVDNVSGFVRDKEYGRSYQLDKFNISARLAEPHERFLPLERPRRAIAKFLAKHQKFRMRAYIEQEKIGYDSRLLSLKLVHSHTTIDGLWQSEAYFRDIRDKIKSEFKIIQPGNCDNTNALRWIKKNNTVAIHIRWFGELNSTANVPLDYYLRALREINDKVDNPHYALFSDNPSKTIGLLNLPQDRTLIIDWNTAEGGEIDDLSLMMQCNHFVIANSTFSWWGAWLGSIEDESIVIFPRLMTNPESWAWDYEGQMPEKWMAISVSR